ncbi:hypothetical protein HOO54_04640 [Bacillus sp. WMMC1349]|uniref:hypothetical protein n=1 Tax=Bacillus sp. WMMC1349 TaxID=2736254 RepID=UPI001552121C|nr:hypothetical protein [Bacillus sp. WMMC1349]NPC91551.1 hypothetical protein [Bacillus sp. WMMC1349]
MFSFKKSRYYWLRSNAVLILLVGLLFTNLPYWNKDDSGVSMFLFIFFAECFIILISFVYGFKTRKGYSSPRKRVFNKSNWVQGFLTFLLLIVFFSYALHGFIPVPSALLYISLSVNLVMAFYSLLAPSAVGVIFENY